MYCCSTYTLYSRCTKGFAHDERCSRCAEEFELTVAKQLAHVSATIDVSAAIAVRSPCMQLGCAYSRWLCVWSLPLPRKNLSAFPARFSCVRERGVWDGRRASYSMRETRLGDLLGGFYSILCNKEGTLERVHSADCLPLTYKYMFIYVKAQPYTTRLPSWACLRA